MRSFDIAVVGAGPAGIAAALAAANSGRATLLIDEHPSIGGQLRWRLSPTMNGELPLGIDSGPGPQVASQLEQRLHSTPNLTVETGTVAWGLFEDNILGLSTDRQAEQVQARTVILATGSTDIALPFPGWTLPGVLTARAVQIFMHIHRVLPGRRWAILGDPDESGELRADIEMSGASVVCIVDDIESVRASGTNRLAHVESGVDVYEVDGLAIALGRQPDPELAIQAQADVMFDWELGGYVPVRAANGATSVPEVYVAGDAAGVGTIAEVLAEGWFVGLTASGASSGEVSAAEQEYARFASVDRQAALERIMTEAAGSHGGNDS